MGDHFWSAALDEQATSRARRRHTAKMHPFVKRRNGSLPRRVVQLNAYWTGLDLNQVYRCLGRRQILMKKKGGSTPGPESMCSAWPIHWIWLEGDMALSRHTLTGELRVLVRPGSLSAQGCRQGLSAPHGSVRRESTQDVSVYNTCNFPARPCLGPTEARPQPVVHRLTSGPIPLLNR